MRTLVAALSLAFAPLAVAAADPSFSVISTGTCAVSMIVSSAPGVVWLSCGGWAYAKLTTATGELTVVSDVRPNWPMGMAAASDGSVFVTTDHGIVRISLDGTTSLISTRSATSLALDGYGNLWFVFGHTAGRFTPSGAVTEFPLASDTVADSLVLGPDRNLWFTDRAAVCRMTPEGVVTPFSVPTPFPQYVLGPLFAAGRDLIVAGTLFTPAWRITTDGVISGLGYGFRYSAATPDGKLWFTNGDGFGVLDGTSSRTFSDGASGWWTDFPIYARPAVASGPDGIVWYSRFWTWPQPLCYAVDPIPGQPPPPPQCTYPPPTPTLPNVLVRVDPQGRKKHRTGPVA